jgi:hypothetical protein
MLSFSTANLLLISNEIFAAKNIFSFVGVGLTPATSTSPGRREKIR